MASLKDIGERALIDRIMRIVRKPDGIQRDDAAIVDMDGSLAISSDSVTFKGHMPKTMDYEEFGWYAAAVNFSDIASMGASPAGIVVSLMLPPDMDETDLYDIMSGIDQCAEFCGTHVIGGDTKPGEGAVCCTAIGSMCGRTPMTRSNARPGDMVAVTGRIGSAAAGFHALELGIDEKDAIAALKTPVPRADEGIALSKAGVVTCMDISDGLSSTACAICGMSGVGMDIMWSSIPFGDGVERMSAHVPIDDMVLNFGGDFELMFTFPPDRLQKLYDEDLEFTIIGTVNDTGKVCVLKNGTSTEIGNGGYEHFKG